MKQNYENLIKYFVDNEFDNKENDTFNVLPSIRNDERNINLLQMIVDFFNDEELLHDLETSVIKDMFVYYTKHKQDFEPQPFEYI